LIAHFLRSKMIKTWVIGAFCGATIGTGFTIGVDLFSIDGNLKLHEFLIVAAVLPIFTTILTRRLFRTSRWRILPVSYLTLFFPVLGPSFGASGSEPIWAFSLLGCMGGMVWITPFVLRDLVRGKNFM